ncbi:MAG: DUF6596 domain-containing protein [Ilumatobacter sp.]
MWRVEAPHVLAALLRRHGDFASCEDAAQEAMLAASQQWPVDGVPDNPRGWLVRVAARRLIDRQRSETARRRREQIVAADPLAGSLTAERVEAPGRPTMFGDPAIDDTLHLLIVCAHPALRPSAQVALTLRSVAGLTTPQIAAAFLVPEATMAQRIVRAKAMIMRDGKRLSNPTMDELPGRIHTVRHVLYLVFNEGYTTSGGGALVDVDLADEAIRLAEHLHRVVPSDTETAGLLALMLLTHGRTPARTDGADLVPLSMQDRTLWDRRLIDRGTRLIEDALPSGTVGPFQLQASIAAVHAEAATASATDWAQIVELYRMLDRVAPSPVVTLNKAVAVGMADGAEAGLAVLAPLLADSPHPTHRVHATHAHLLELAGEVDGALAAYRRAASLTNSIPEQRYLNHRAIAIEGQ